MDHCCLILLSCGVLAASAWSVPFYPVPRAPLRFTRFAPHPRQLPAAQHRAPVRESEELSQYQKPSEDSQWQRPKRDHDDYDHDHDHGHGRDHHASSGVTGPVHTFVKTDKNANYKWGVRHHVGNKFAS